MSIALCPLRTFFAPFTPVARSIPFTPSYHPTFTLPTALGPLPTTRPQTNGGYHRVYGTVPHSGVHFPSLEIDTAGGQPMVSVMAPHLPLARPRGCHAAIERHEKSFPGR